VELVVGESETSFHVHKDFLCEASPFFRAALTTDFREATEERITLLEDDVDTVDRFVQWLYTKSYQLPSSEGSKQHYLQLARLYVLADKLQVRALKDEIIRVSFRVCGSADVTPPSMSVVAYVFENTMENSAFRRLIVANFVWEIDRKWYNRAKVAAEIAEVPSFGAELAICMAKRIAGGSSPFSEDVQLHYDSETECKGSDT
jgi:hypothetical protein